MALTNGVFFFKDENLHKPKYQQNEQLLKYSSHLDYGEKLIR